MFYQLSKSICTTALDRLVEIMALVLHLCTKCRDHKRDILLRCILHEADLDRRLELCERLIDMCIGNAQQVTHIIFVDDSKLNGEVNRINCSQKAKKSPRWMRGHHTHYPQKVNVWAGSFRNEIIEPYFIDGSISGPSYLQPLQQYLIPTLYQLLAYLCLSRSNLAVFVENGTSMMMQVRIYYYQLFVDICICKYVGGLEDMKPNLTPLDFLLCYLENIEYKSKPHSIEELGILSSTTLDHKCDRFLKLAFYVESKNKRTHTGCSIQKNL